MSEGQETFGQHIRRARLRLGYSVRKVELLTSRLPEEQRVSNSYLSQVERDEVPPPSPAKIMGLSKVLSLDYEDLMRRAGHLPGERVEDIALPVGVDLSDPNLRLTLQKLAELPPEDRAEFLRMITPLLDQARDLQRMRAERRRQREGQG
ncbi:MAG: helix-turn-helix domain-containing protein [Chloroflexi bacterium]|nr:helix-turn-helix domain-containing protein [Chloroflexota bacterium]MCL5107925.1 helix-turn-helix domain-containing protein [Chloroflexota bacterium]